MSSEWSFQRIGDVGRVVTGKTPSTSISENFDGPYPFITIPDLGINRYVEYTTRSISDIGAKAIANCMLPDRAVLMSCIATIGKSGITTKASFTNQQINAVICGSQITPEFLYYTFCQLGVQLETAGGGGSVYTNVSKSRFSDIKISVPPIEVQNEIASILGVLDDRIAVLRETNTTLESIAQTLFKSWFVDFDPVRAKMEGRVPEGMDEATAALFPDSFEETELGLVPKSWKVGRLDHVAKTERKQLSASELSPDLHYVGLEHMPRKSLSLLSWGKADGLESAKALFEEGDILFGKLRPYFHKVVIAPFGGVCSTDILVCRPILDDYQGLVAMHLFSDTLVKFADRLSNGAKMPRVSWKDLAAYPICVPPLKLASIFSECFKPLTLRMMASAHQAQTLVSLRDSLLPRLISGQLRLPEANAIAQAAM